MTVTSDPKKWLAYWKVSLADMELGRGVFTARQMQSLQAGVLPQDRIDEQKLTPIGDWMGQGGEHDVLTMAAAKDWFEGDSSFVVTDQRGRWVQAIVYPFVFLLEQRHQRGQARQQFVPQMVAPISFTVRLYEDGSLYPEGRPGVPRELLDPSNGARPFVIGGIDDLDAFFDQYPFPEWQDPLDSRWSLREVIDYCQSMLQAMGRVDLRQPMGADGPRYMELPNALIHKGRIGEGAIRPLLTLYDTLIHRPESAVLPARLQEFEFSGRAAPTVERSITTRTASMEGTALSDDQKQALASAVLISDGQLQSINGPPGTGKTAVVKDIVATLFAQAAIKRTSPPLILLSSNNNQAVTNVLDVFSRMSGTRPIERWIEGWQGFGMYAPAYSREQQASTEGYTTVEMVKAFERDFESSRGETYFLSKASQHFGQSIETLDQAEKLLMSRLQGHASILNFARQLRSRFSSLKTSRDLKKVRAIIAKLKVHTANRAPSAIDQLEKWCELAAHHLKEIQRAARHHDHISRYQRQLNSRLPHFALQWSRSSTVLWQKCLPLLVPGIYAAAAENWRDIVFNIAPNGDIGERRRAIRSISVSPEWDWLIDHLDRALDQTCRRQLFEMAVHWHECQWLYQMRDVLHEKQRSGRSFHNVDQALNRRAMLAPVLVGTFYTLPRQMTFWDAIEQREMALTDRADYLIVDEAGQAGIEVAVPTLALARKGIIIGDTEQLDPVRRVARPIDLANLIATGVIPSVNDSRELEAAVEPLIQHHKVCHDASLLRSVRSLSVFHNPMETENGAHLTVHRRSVPSIIEFCNRLAYQGKLKPVREARGLSIEGVDWLHVGGIAHRYRGSRLNPAEASVIAAWLAENMDILKQQYPGKAVGDIVGIVTPFHQQAQCIRAALATQNINQDEMTVGTVHSLQGAERPVIILSLTYSQLPHQALFFDLEPQMLNVAVSRAQDALIVFGDMNALHHGDQPSKLLLDHLGQYGEPSELPVFQEDAWSREHGEMLGSIVGRDAHDQWLQELVSAGQWNRLWIATPVLGLLAAQKHGSRLIRAASTGRDVRLFISRQHTLVNGYDRACLELIENFKLAGVHVEIVEWFEGSAVIIDDKRVAVTDGDWLSAMPEHRDWGIQRRSPKTVIVQGESAQHQVKRLAVSITRAAHAAPCP
ncbi:hypothetical protein EZI54_07135 [Marinobacter halodurans]|uniref:DNA2/NAM7 helicase-like C-terminal domain-containing protein n=1 Tax=Marinobacter halodurans TaxID=2528979 RepID=A0ABY1ZRD5_9GAMM|nr:AAA domain-containing protein [Marinobacter halodurans]TBW57425.1 hypothetical protein EZI54_07135 [Marinobacter halodurans]